MTANFRTARSITLGIAVALGVAGSAGAADTMQVNMGGSTTTSGFYPYYTAVANSINKVNPDINVTVVSSGGFAKNSNLLMKGELDFGGTSPDLLADAEVKGFDKFRVLWWAIPSIQNIMARKDSGITDITQFDGKCFHPGMNGSSSQKNMLRILKALDVEPKLYLSDPKDAINAIKNGRCLGQIKSISGKHLDAATAELNVSTQMWPVGYTEEQIKRIKEQIPWMGFYDIPAGIVDGAPSYTVHALWIGFAATSDMSEDTAYKITKGMWEGFDDQGAAFKPIASLNIPRQTINVSATPLHAGAVRYYREIGLDIPARLIPPEAQ